MSDEEVITKALSRKRKKGVSFKGGLSSGSTLVNLAATGRTKVCFLPGHYYWIAGSSDSGKTWLTWTTFAEACMNPKFDDYRLIFDNSENGSLMNVSRFFGQKCAERWEPPKGTQESPTFSRTVEDMYEYIDDAVKDGRPFIWVEDSMDALFPESDEEKFNKRKRSRQRNPEAQTAGSFGMAKAKLNSENLRRVISDIRKSGSILILISQARDSVGFGSRFEPERASGGRSLKFYATLQIWANQRGKIKKVVRKKPRQLGIICRMRLKKNRIVGKDRTVDIPIYHSFGIDDVGSCIDYLVEEGHWSGSKDKSTGTVTKVNAKEFDYNGTREGLVQKIQEEGLESELRILTGEVWSEIEAACAIKRKSRYE